MRRKFLSVIGGTALAFTLLAPVSSALAAGSGGGGGGTGEETTLGNNLSVPTMFIGDTATAPALRIAIDSTGILTAQEPTGTTSTDFPDYYIQGTDATWSAYAATAESATVTAQWGSNLKDSSALSADKPIRVEVGLLDMAAVGDPYQGYVVTNLTPDLEDRYATYGTDGTTFLSGEAVGEAVQSTRVWAPNTTLKITNVETGAVMYNGAIAAEINSTGAVVYGFNWGGGNTTTSDPAGTYLLSFSVDKAVTIDAVTPGTINQPIVANPYTTSLVVTVGGSGGGSETGGGVQVTSATSADFATGQAGTFTVTATGEPTPQLAEVGALPTGVTFKNNGDGTATLAGTPAVGTGNASYPLTIVAYNGTSSIAQTFTLNVAEVAVEPGEGGVIGGGGSSSSASSGYRMVGSDGGVFTFGNASYYGSMGGTNLNEPVVGTATDPSTGGYWLVARDGGVFAFNASYYGSTGGTRLNSPVVSMAADHETGGYWLVAADGGVFAFGDASFYGSMGSTQLNQSIVGMASDTATGGYWLVGSDGGVFNFNAPMHGSMGGIHLNQPIVGMATDSTTGGYWLIGQDGGVFTFNASYHGSMGGTHLNSPVVAVGSAS